MNTIDYTNEDMIQLQNKTEEIIKCVCEDMSDFLIEKNRKYGNSAMNPVRIFSKASDVEQLFVRMDDKLSRIRTSNPEDLEDSILDLAGYMVIYMAKRRLSE